MNLDFNPGQGAKVHCIPHLTNTLIKPANFPPVVVDLRQIWDELEVDLFMVQIILCKLYAHLAASLSAITSFDKYNIVKVAPGKMLFWFIYCQRSILKIEV